MNEQSNNEIIIKEVITEEVQNISVPNSNKEKKELTQDDFLTKEESKELKEARENSIKKEQELHAENKKIEDEQHALNEANNKELQEEHDAEINNSVNGQSEPSGTSSSDNIPNTERLAADKEEDETEEVLETITEEPSKDTNETNVFQDNLAIIIIAVALIGALTFTFIKKKKKNK